MGTRILVVVDNDDPQVGKELEKVPGWFEEWEQALSRFRPTSELSQLNRNTGVPFRASPLLWELLQAALEAVRQSDGLVSPALLPELEKAGYQQSFHLMGAGAAASSPIAESYEAELTDIQMDLATRTIILPSGMRLDFGGIAKGWAAEQTAQRLQALGPVLADAGGDIAVRIPAGETQGWEIAVKDAYAPEKNVDTIWLSKGGVATSGRDRRRWQQEGHWQHHIIDPRTGLPAETDVLAATVIANTAIEAEMAAKAVLILGSQAGLEWLEQRPGCHGMVILENSNIIYGTGFESYIRTEPWH